MQVLQRRFRHGEPAQMLRDAACDILLGPCARPPNPEWIDDVLLVVSELVQNVTQHTRSHGELVLILEPGVIVVEVGDTSTTVPRVRHPDTTQVGGRGMLLVDAVSQGWGVRICPAGKIVWARLVAYPDPVPPGEPAAGPAA